MATITGSSTRLITGDKGHGKTLYGVFCGLRRVSLGCAFFTNVELNIDACEKYLWHDYGWKVQPGQITVFKTEDIPRLHEVTGSGTAESFSYVLVDETVLQLYAGDWARANDARNAERQLLQFINQARHEFTDVDFICVHTGIIFKQLRKEAEEVLVVRSLYWKKLPYIPFALPIPIRLVTTWDKDLKMRLGAPEWHGLLRDLYPCYNSWSRVMDFKRKAKGLRFTGKRHLTWGQLQAPVCAALLIACIAGWKGYRYYEKKQAEKLSVAVSTNGIPVSPAASKPRVESHIKPRQIEPGKMAARVVGFAPLRFLGYCVNRGRIECLLSDGSICRVGSKSKDGRICIVARKDRCILFDGKTMETVKNDPLITLRN